MKTSHLIPSISAQAMVSGCINCEDIKENGGSSIAVKQNSTKHGTDHNVTVSNGTVVASKGNNTIQNGSGSSKTNVEKNTTCGAPDVQLIFASQEQAIKASFGHEQVMYFIIFLFNLNIVKAVFIYYVTFLLT